MLKHFPPLLPPQTSCVAHYTTMAAFESIITDSGVCLRATHYRYYDDELEYQWPLSLTTPIIQAIAKERGEEFDPETQVYPYTLSFSNALDSEYLWNNYGDNGNGVMLVFDRLALYAHCNQHMEQTGETRLCSDVYYADSDNYSSVINQAFHAISRDFHDIDPTNNLYECPAFVKNKKAFQNEHEFRIAHCAHNSFMIQGTPEQITDFEEIPSGIKFRTTKNGLLVPYIEIMLPKTALVGVCLGRKISTLRNFSAVETMLRTRNYSTDLFSLTL